MIPFKDWLYLGAIAAIVAFGFYLRAHLINEGEAKVRDAQAKAIAAQQVKDAEVSTKAIGDLNDEIAMLHSLNLEPWSVRCTASKVQPTRSSSGTISPPASHGDSPEVPAGANVGTDIYPKLRLIAEALDLKECKT